MANSAADTYSWPERTRSRTANARPRWPPRVYAPLSPRTGSDLFREAFRARVLPAVDNFSPDLIIISAGFDAHHRDPLAEMYLTEEDFDWATGQLLDRAARSAGNRLVSLLEGGYDLDGLSSSVAAHVRRMMKG